MRAGCKKRWEEGDELCDCSTGVLSEEGCAV